MIGNLIEDLKSEHTKIAEALNEVVHLGIGNHEGQEKLMNAKNMLLLHLQKEDTFLYPKLDQAAQDDEQIKHTLDSFARDMDGISKVALEFFAKYENGGEGIEFAKDFGHLFSALSMRIRREENHLYKIYEDLN